MIRTMEQSLQAPTPFLGVSRALLRRIRLSRVFWGIWRGNVHQGVVSQSMILKHLKPLWGIEVMFRIAKEEFGLEAFFPRIPNKGGYQEFLRGPILISGRMGP